MYNNDEKPRVDAPGSEPSALDVRNLVKEFNQVSVLSGFSITLRRGEVHGLLGANGSGKSTFIKILSGYHRADGGKIDVSGHHYDYPDGSQIDPEECHIAFVHQDLGLLNDLTIYENFYLDSISREPSLRWIPWSRRRRYIQSVLSDYGISLSAATTVASLAPLDKARIAILRAYYALQRSIDTSNASDRITPLLVLDEPTVFLPEEDREKLAGLIHGIVSANGSVLLVSHDLKDIRQLTQAVTVLRDGRSVATVDTARTTDNELITLLLDRNPYREDRRPDGQAQDGPMRSPLRPGHTEEVAAVPAAPTLLTVEHLQGGRVRDASFSLRRGEVVGLTGLAGCGFEDVVYMLYGATKALNGSLAIEEVTIPARRMNIPKARQLGFALVPADRPLFGGIAELSAAENLVMPALDELRTRSRLLSTSTVEPIFADTASAYGITPHSPSLPFGRFSGGNQQKIVVGKWMRTAPQLMLLDEPTQGVDVGAKFDLVSAIQEAASNGMAVIWSTTDEEELARVAGRVLVFRNGTIAQEIFSPTSRDEIIQACYGSGPDSSPAADGSGAWERSVERRLGPEDGSHA